VSGTYGLSGYALMSKDEILDKAVQKAKNSGWQQPWVGDYSHIQYDLITGELFIYWQYKDFTPFGCSLIGLIFNHDFAKALWGEKINDIMNGDDELYGAPWYLVHLSRMVRENNPIEYLGKNI